MCLINVICLFFSKLNYIFIIYRIFQLCFSLFFGSGKNLKVDNKPGKASPLQSVFRGFLFFLCQWFDDVNKIYKMLSLFVLHQRVINKQTEYNSYSLHGTLPSRRKQEDMFEYMNSLSSQTISGSKIRLFCNFHTALEVSNFHIIFTRKFLNVFIKF